MEDCSGGASDQGSSGKFDILHRVENSTAEVSLQFSRRPGTYDIGKRYCSFV